MFKHVFVDVVIVVVFALCRTHSHKTTEQHCQVIIYLFIFIPHKLVLYSDALSIVSKHKPRDKELCCNKCSEIPQNCLHFG